MGIQATTNALRTGRFIPGESSPPPHPAKRERAGVPDSHTDRSWFWTPSSEMNDVRRGLELAAGTNINVLIIGETGTGKELVARHLHELRRERLGLSLLDAPFVAINCGALPEALAESLLFGHERGAFTSARERQHGKFETARLGTLFLDEVQTLSPSVQVKLLRVIQHREFERLGAKSPATVGCQIVAATNIPLELLVDRQHFRRDLYYRLNICPVYLPSLRERVQDLPSLAEGILSQLARHHRLKARTVSPEALRLLEQHPWPGNIRELEHSLLYAALRGGESIEANHLPPTVTGQLADYLSKGRWDV